MPYSYTYISKGNINMSAKFLHAIRQSPLSNCIIFFASIILFGNLFYNSITIFITPFYKTELGGSTLDKGLEIRYKESFMAYFNSL
jgi:hypothetical protein